MEGNQELREKLIASLAQQGEAFHLQRRLQKMAAEMPLLQRDAALAQLLGRSSAAKGADFEARLSERDIKVMTILDASYPLLLREIADPPLLLYVRGELQSLQRPCISIVGARACTLYGQQVARKLAAELAQLGFTVVSGLAVGIDTMAHQACLDVSGRTVAVLGSGLQRVYPKQNRDLVGQILDRNGSVLSEFLPMLPAKPFHFPIRNRIISGLSHATIVVEAKEKSGSLGTARFCLEQNRELFAVPGPINRPVSMGVNRLIAEGQARLLLSVDSVLEELQPLIGRAIRQRQNLKNKIKDSIAQKIYDRLDFFEAVPLDCLVVDLGLEPGQVMAKLTELESLNMVEQRPGQVYVRCPI